MFVRPTNPMSHRLARLAFITACVAALVVASAKQKTAYEMEESDWSSDVCSSDLIGRAHV